MHTHDNTLDIIQQYIAAQHRDGKTGYSYLLHYSTRESFNLVSEGKTIIECLAIVDDLARYYELFSMPAHENITCQAINKKTYH